MRAPDDSEAVARLDLINSDHVDGVAARLISSGVIVLNAIALETNADRLVFTQSAGDEARIHLLNPGESTERLEVRGNPNNGGLFRVFTNGGARDGEFRVRDGAGGHHTLLYMNQGATPELEVKGDFTVSGSKNAEIPDPVDATKAYRFAAIEADEPGLLFHRLTVTVPPGAAEETIALPAHWERIATDGDAMVTALDSTRDQAPAAAAVDLSVPEVTVRGKPGDYRVWVLAVRADPAISGWAHEVANTEE